MEVSLLFQMSTRAIMTEMNTKVLIQESLSSTHNSRIIFISTLFSLFSRIVWWYYKVLSNITRTIK